MLGPDEVVVRLGERTYSPVLRATQLPSVKVPWWGGRRLCYELAQPAAYLANSLFENRS